MNAVLHIVFGSILTEEARDKIRELGMTPQDYEVKFIYNSKGEDVGYWGKHLGELHETDSTGTLFLKAGAGIGGVQINGEKVNFDPTHQDVVEFGEMLEKLPENLLDFIEFPGIRLIWGTSGPQ